MRRRRGRFVIWVPVPGWWKMAAAACLVLIVIAALGKGLSSQDTWSNWSLPLSGKVIVVDAGHGGIDGGAKSKSGILEKHINLSIALYLRDYLQEAGALVVMTRELDDDLAERTGKGRHREDLQKRVEIVRNSGADMLISIHMNSVPSSRWSGAQTFFHPERHPDNRLFASLVQEELIRNLGNTNRTISKLEDILLLKSVDIPSVLIEVGFLSNPQEAAMLADEHYQKKVAGAIYRGVLRYASGEKLG